MDSWESCAFHQGSKDQYRFDLSLIERGHVHVSVCLCHFWWETVRQNDRADPVSTGMCGADKCEERIASTVVVTVEQVL